MRSVQQISRAFILGAGLGMRLRPLTKSLPKPLVMVGGQPLVAYALAHLSRIGVRDVIINTHHAASCWENAFPRHEAAGVRITYRYEPVLLDTGGGLKNVEDFLAGHGTFLIYNGDILTSLPLERAIAHHLEHGNLVTMVLRSKGGPKHVTLDTMGRVASIHSTSQGSDRLDTYLFTGVHVVESAIFQYIPRVQVESIIQIYLNLIRQGYRVGGVVLDEGEWLDIGTPSEYERANHLIGDGHEFVTQV